MHIGVFDSGVGGMTVLAALRDAFPQHEYTYLGDTARVPYGGKSHDVLHRYGIELLDFMTHRSVDAVVVACNTLSSTVLSSLQNHVRIPVYGVIDPAVAYVNAIARGAIGVIGTRATIASHAFSRGIHLYDPERTVIELACPLLVPLVEEGWIDSPVTRQIIETYLAPLARTPVTALILGCTHYPLLRDVIADVVGSDVYLIASGPALVEHLQRDPLWLGTAPIVQDRSKEIHWFATDATESFGRMAQALGFDTPNVEVIAID